MSDEPIRYLGTSGKSEYVSAATRLPVDVGGATVNIEGDVTVSNEVEVTNDAGNPIPVNDAGGSLTVDATSWPLPTGAATEAKQDTLIGHVDGLEALLTTIDVDTGAIDAKLPTLSSGRIPVDIGAISLGDVEIKNDIGNPIPTSVPVRTPTTTSVASSATSVTILASNANRRGISIANDSTATLRLSFTNPATSANAFMVMQPGSFLLLDQQLIVTNAIYGIWASANGTAQVTEYV